MSTPVKIFLAHASEDKKQIRDLYLRLKSLGFEPWLDEFDLIPGQNWQLEIPKAIRQSDIFVACLSKRSVEKQGYVQKEYRLALNVYAEKPVGSIYLIPLKLDDCTIPDLQNPEFGVKLRDIQWLDYWKSNGFEQLIRAIQLLLTETESINKKTIQLGWELSFKASIYEIKALAVYNGKLYASGEDDGQINGRIYQHDGITWNDLNFSSMIGAKVDFVESLQVFNNRLYIGTRVDVGDRKFARVYYYDGTKFVLDFSASGQPGYSGIEDLAVHNNTLYAANGSPISEVYQRNSDNNWTTLGSPIEIDNPVRALASFNDSLFAGTGSYRREPKVWRWTDTEWVLASNFRGDFELNQDSVFSLVSIHGKLYAGLAGPGNKSPIFAYDGASWTITHSISGCNYARLATIGNRLWVGTHAGRVFCCIDDSIWEEMDSIIRGPGVLNLIQYDEFVYASTFSEGAIYRMRLKEELRD